MTYHAITFVGDRETNDNNAACLAWGSSFCFVVADGLGGHGHSEVASRIAVERCVSPSRNVNSSGVSLVTVNAWLAMGLPSVSVTVINM